VSGSHEVGKIAAKLRQSLLSPVNRIRAHERRKMEKIAALEQRITTLEAELRGRMAAVETALQRCPGEACPYCGERALRLKKASRPIGSGRGTWRRETWVCGACGREDWRHRNYPD
jgi:uncharacterized protein with PIN domain